MPMSRFIPVRAALLAASTALYPRNVLQFPSSKREPYKVVKMEEEEETVSGGSPALTWKRSLR